MTQRFTPKKAPAVKEKAIENSILSFLKLHGIFCFKVESQGTYDAKLGRYRMKHSIHRMLGVADIIAIIDGQFIAIEVKSASGRLSEHQKRFMFEVMRHGGRAIVARSVEDVATQLNLDMDKRFRVREVSA
jgi:hypothetical protein